MTEPNLLPLLFDRIQRAPQFEDRTIEEVYKRLCGFYLSAPARYETLLNLKGDDNVQQSVIDAITAFEKENPNAGVTLPKNDYRKIPDAILRDARGGEAEVRQRMVKARLVDVMITLASNFFYTVTLPVTLWFFDRAKTDAKHPHHDQTLSAVIGEAASKNILCLIPF